MKINSATIFLFIGILFCKQVLAAGQIEMVEGIVTIINVKGESRNPQKGETVGEGDTLITGRNGELHVRLDDNGLIALRANTRLKIEAYRARGDNEDKAFFSLLKGTFRSITGWIGRYNAKNYGIKTPTATIGVRGTDHEPLVVTDPEPGEVVTLPPGTYDKVNTGITVLGNKFGTTLLNPNQAGFAPKSAPPKPLIQIPDIFKPTKNEKVIDKNKELLNKSLELRLKDRQQDLIKKRGTDEQPGKILPKLLGDIKTENINPVKEMANKQLVPAVTPMIRGADGDSIPILKPLSGQSGMQPQMLEPGKLPVLTLPAPVLTPMAVPAMTLPGATNPGVKTPMISPVLTPTLSAPVSVIKSTLISTPAITITPMRMLAK